ncbi:MAG: glycosyltransferase family 9 protein [Pirellulales bacterium]|nr:glycosyltransferase family 9 protein [Pirellulales bacterium]
MRILILKPSSLGDIICALPVAQSIRQQCPEAVISWVVKKRFAEVVRRCATVNGEVIVFNHRKGLRGLPRLHQVVREVERRQYDAVLDFQGLLRTGWMTWRAHASLKVGSVFAREGSRLAYNAIVPAPEGGRSTHAIDKLLQFLPAIGLQPELRSPIEIRGDAPDVLDSRLANAHPIVILPNSRGAHKEWQYYPELTAGILEQNPDSLVVWDSHLPWDDPVANGLSRFVNLTARTSLLQMVELLRRAKLVIANDSGPLHIAAALGRPTLGLFGPTSPELYGPYPLELPRNNVLTAPGGHLSQLSSETVLRKVCEIISCGEGRRHVA